MAFTLGGGSPCAGPVGAAAAAGAAACAVVPWLRFVMPWSTAISGVARSSLPPLDDSCVGGFCPVWL
eukprot:1535082-Pyramimonas_sp.AAC.1